MTFLEWLSVRRFGITLTVIIGGFVAILIAVVLLTDAQPSMYINGYVPAETGERVLCVYERKTQYVMVGKVLTPHTEHWLHCQEVK
jgi:hypothetical protein